MSKRCLIIGNDRYEDGRISKFSINNGDAVGKKLHEIGFQVTLAKNLAHVQMSQTIKAFTEEIRQNDLIVFYFAGHSVQWRNELYLLPVDNQRFLDQPSTHDNLAISVQTTVDGMIEQKPLASILLFDCYHRQVPVDRSIDERNRLVMRGHGNYLIALACDEYESMSHRSADQRHSLFTHYLLRHISEYNMKIEEMILRVCDQVKKEAGENFRICRFSCLYTCEIYLNLKKSSMKVSPSSSGSDRTWLGLRFHDVQRTSIVKPDEMESQLVRPPKVSAGKILDRIAGSMLGLAMGDALGAHVEFRPHDLLVEHPVTDLTGGGTWGLRKGQFTDDTSMALCLALSLIACRGFNAYDQLVRYKWWFRHGYMSSTGECFDIGAATKKSIEEFERRQHELMQQSGIATDQIDGMGEDERVKSFPVECGEEGTAGNGALMRLAPIPLFFFREAAEAIEYAGKSSVTTHADVKSIDACRYYAALIVAALHDRSKENILDDRFYDRHRSWFGKKEIHPEILSIARGSYKKKGGYEDGIRGSGYVVKSLEAALWSFWSTRDFEAGALAAVNLGDDTDTTAAIYGQLAGAYYGWKNLPEHWLNDLYSKKLILTLCHWIGYEGNQWNSRFHIESSMVQSRRSDGLSSDSSMNDFRNWSCEDVVRWLQSRGEPFNKYADKIREKQINGKHLIQLVDPNQLIDLGINDKHEQEVIFNAIQELRETTLMKFYRLFHGDDYTFPLRILGTSIRHHACILRRNSVDPDHRRIYRKIVRWIEGLPPDVDIGTVSLLPPNERYQNFLDRILSSEIKMRQAEYQPHFEDESNPPARSAALARLRMLTEKVRNHRSVSIARVWYGCNLSKMRNIIENGFQEQHKVDQGLYGKGIYFSSTAKEAAFHAGFDGYVIMCYVILLNPFPVIVNDISTDLLKQNFRFYQSERHLNYQCNFVPVSPYETRKGIRNLPPFNGLHEAQFDQIVMFDPADILDQVVIQVKRKRDDRSRSKRRVSSSYF